MCHNQHTIRKAIVSQEVHTSASFILLQGNYIQEYILNGQRFKFGIPVTSVRGMQIVMSIILKRGGVNVGYRCLSSKQSIKNNTPWHSEVRID